MSRIDLSRRVFRLALRPAALAWLLALLLFLPGTGNLIASNSTGYPAQMPGQIVYFCPLVVNRWTAPPPFVISEVLFDPVDFEPGAEWVELYNYGSQEVVLSGYMLGDAHEAGGHEGMYIFPPEAVISPEEVIIITPDASGFERTYGFKPDFELYSTDPVVPDMIRNPAWAVGSMSLNNLGDEVLLLFLSGAPVDLVSWGDSTTAFSPSVPVVPEGHSIERYPASMDTDTNADWRDQPHPSPGQIDRTPLPTHTPLPATATALPTFTQMPVSTATHTPAPTSTATHTPTPTGTSSPGDHLLISEVLYSPLYLDAQYEWIEVYNPTTENIELSDYKIGDEESIGGNEGMLRFPPGAMILAGENAVIAHEALSFYSSYGFMPDFEMEDSDPDVADMLIYSAWADGSIVLDDDGDEVLLIGAGDLLIDALSWGTSNWAFDPACLPVGVNHSLERYPGDMDTNTADDWREQNNPNPGSPPVH